jgi:GDP-L-fucose synthase
MNLTTDRIYIAGHAGMVGSALHRALINRGCRNIQTATHLELELTHEIDVEKFFKKHTPDIVILCAAKVGGINANIKQPVDFITKNIKIQNNVISMAYKYGVKRLIFMASSCIYPRFCPQPMRIEHLFSGQLEPTNEGYALAKILGIKLLEAYMREYKFDSVTILPCNLYGPNDSFDLENSHVLSAFVKKFVDAEIENNSSITLWGTGEARREFMHVDDFANAVILLEENKINRSIVNIGSGKDISIKALATLVAGLSGYGGEIKWDASKPEGMLKKLMDNSDIELLGFESKINLKLGIEQMISIYRNIRSIK